MISYNIDDNGILRVYLDDCILCEISDCGKLSHKKVNNLIDDLVKESGNVG